VLDQITPLILTYNEESNLERTMRQLHWANDVVVVDSFSDDNTTDIAQSFRQTRLFQREFDSHENQWTFALTKTEIKTPWVLALDADYVLPDELVSELQMLQPEPEVNGYSAQFVYCLRGKQLRSGIYPPVTVLYRANEAEYEQDGHTHRVKVKGEVRSLKSKILHDDRKPFKRWLLSQVNYAQLEARKLQQAETYALSIPDRVRKLRIVAPAGVLFYCLVWRGGLFDGRAGLLYALQRTLAELLLSLSLFHVPLRRDSKQRIDEAPRQRVSTTTR
jgi:glycosyltransferase involved in cell wall biosynthesis